MKWHQQTLSPQANRKTSKRRKSAAREKFLAVVCGHSANTDASTTEGLHSYTDHVENSILDLLKDHGNAETLQIILGPSDNPYNRVDQLLDMCVVLSEDVDNLTSRTSLDNLSDAILSRYKIETEISKQNRACMLEITSACVGWLSMLYINPQITAQTAHGLVRATTGQDVSGQLKATGDVPNRPIGALLKISGLIPIACGTPCEPGNNSIHLMTTKLNFASLQGLGGITVQWVDEIAQHCNFDKGKKVIKVFRFPSRCLALCRKGSVNIALQRCVAASTVDLFYVKGWRGIDMTLTGLCRICQAHGCRYDCAVSVPAKCQLFHGEVLLSYRLLFGQDRRARRSYRKVRRNIPLPRDPVLDGLCGKCEWSCLEEQEDLFPEREVYDGSNFPQLGQKLFELQDYITSQKPRTLRDVWNDRRDPHQAFTFWAVVLVGGATILLGLVQVVLSGLQLAYTIRP
jgi:hypothetical protein